MVNLVSVNKLETIDISVKKIRTFLNQVSHS